MPLKAHHARTAEKSRSWTKNNEEEFSNSRHGYSAWRIEELCYPSADPSIIVIQVMLKFLSNLGKGLWACKTLLYGNESTVWQPLNSSESPKQMLLPMFRKEVFVASKSKSNSYLRLNFVCQALFPFFPLFFFCLAGEHSLLERTRP